MAAFKERKVVYEIVKNMNNIYFAHYEIDQFYFVFRHSNLITEQIPRSIRYNIEHESS